MNEILSPAAISGIGTPIITQHLPPGAISYVNGEVIVKTTGAVQTGGRRKTKKRRKTTRRKTIKKVRKHRRSMKKKSLRRRKY